MSSRGGDVPIAISSALAAGLCFAVAGILQQRAASTRTPDESLSGRLLVDLAGEPMWLAGIGLAVLSYGFQALALAFGPLALVQPLIAAEVVFALPLAARLDRVPLQPRDWLGAVMVVGGLAVAIAAAAPSRGQRFGATGPWLLLLLAVAVVTVAALQLGRRQQGPLRASLFALAGASVMGTQSALYATTIDRLPQGVLAVVTAWQTYLLIIASGMGLLLLQSAFNSGPLATSMPVIDTVEPVVAVLAGLLIFDEQLAGGPGRHALAALGAAVALAGILVLDTSPATRRIYETEHEEQLAEKARWRAGGRRGTCGRIPAGSTR